jgi:TolB protein
MKSLLPLLLPGMLSAAILAAPLPRREPAQVLFSTRQDGVYQLFVMKPDGTDAKPVTRGSAHHYYPAWSPDGKTIVCSVQKQQLIHLFTMNADGSGAKPLTQGTVYDKGAAWSPDGKKIAFTRGTPGSNPEVCVIELASRKVVNLTQHPSFDADPAWSPDGKKIAFASYRSNDGFRVYVMDADGRNVKAITSKSNRYGWAYPAWSPDGKKLAFGDQSGTAVELFVCDADGSNRRQLTRLGGYNSYPAWSHQGDRLLFQHHDKRLADGVMYGVDLKSNKVTRLPIDVATPMEGGRPAWRPR